jgi:Protein of unknown function (DUF3991)/Toprim-like
MLHALRKEADRVRAIDLALILRATGCLQDRHDKAKWHTPKGALSVTHQKFFNWRLSVGGGGAIDLIIHLKDLDFKSAVRLLSALFPCTDGALSVHPVQERFRSPKRDDTRLCRVLHYLENVRALPLPLIVSLIDAGTLYADTRGNAVFLLLGKNKNIVGAELRGTTSVRWHGMSPGSQKNLGYFSVPNNCARKIVVCESAIDALSLCALHDDCLAVSASGAHPHPAWLPSLLHTGYALYCGFDADETGDRMAKQMTALYPSVKRLRPAAHDWNDLLRAHQDALRSS